MADTILVGTEQTSSDVWANGGQFGLGKFQATKSGSLTSIRVYIALGDGGSYYGMAALYADNAGAPGSLLTSCGSTSFVGGEPYWKSFAVTPYDVVKDTYYWLAFIGDAKGPFYKSTVSGTMRYRAETYAGFTFPNPPSGLGSYSKIFLYGGWGTETASGPVIPILIQQYRRRR